MCDGEEEYPSRWRERMRFLSVRESAGAQLLRLEEGLGRPAGRGALLGDDSYGAVRGVHDGDGVGCEGRCTVVCRQQYIRVSDLGHVVVRPAIKVLNCFYYLTIDQTACCQMSSL